MNQNPKNKKNPYFKKYGKAALSIHRKVPANKVKAQN